MKTSLEKLTEQLDKFPPLGKKVFEKCISGIDFVLPEDYLAFMRSCNGGEGPVGADAYISFWKADEILELNEAYEVNEYADGYFIFGSDGGGEAYAFNKKTGEIVSFPFVGMLIDDPPTKYGKTLVNFLSRLAAE